MDLFNREIIGYSAGRNKNAALVKSAFGNVNGNLSDIQIFHTDRGCEFKNQAIDEALEVFKIEGSLSKKGCPYDNAVAEVTFKLLKVEFVKNQQFRTLTELQYKLFDYVNWFNHHRIHSSLGYQPLIQFKHNVLENIV